MEGKHQNDPFCVYKEKYLKAVLSQGFLLTPFPILLLLLLLSPTFPPVCKVLQILLPPNGRGVTGYSRSLRIYRTFLSYNLYIRHLA